MPASANAANLIHRLQTPALLLDVGRMEHNIDRMRAAVVDRGVSLRGHLKTSKSLEVARRIWRSDRPAVTVSTLREAEYCFEHGIEDILYAVGITANKLERAFDLRQRGAQLAIVVDSVDAARAVSTHARHRDCRISTLIEVDCDGERAGIAPDQDEALLAIASTLEQSVELLGVLTHAGGSYGAHGDVELRRFAELEKSSAISAAQRLRDSGRDVPVVSIGSTPTALAATDFRGISEVRAGVFVFFDLVMAGIGVCGIDDIAVSVLSTVLSAQPGKGQYIIDAGWMALSRDRGTAAQSLDQGFGLVCDIDGSPIGNLIVASTNQEHGIVRQRPGNETRLPRLAVGDFLRILPNHACATCSQHDGYQVIQSGSHAIVDHWSRFRGW